MVEPQLSKLMTYLPAQKQTFRVEGLVAASGREQKIA
jgi:hypothetical protein